MKKKVLVLAKAEPLTSKKYQASVCAAGITDDGEFIRIYPVPFRIFCDKNTKISKYDWIEVDCEKAEDDKRPEIYKINPDTIKKVGHIDADGAEWSERSTILLPKRVKNLQELSESGASLGLIRPSEILDFKYEKSKDNEEAKVGKEYNKAFQMIFDEEGEIKKIPAINRKYDRHFSYVFKCDGEEKNHKIICEDWELYEAFRKWRDIYKDEGETLGKIRDRFFDTFTTKNDLHFIMGTHYIFKTWIIIGLYYPKKSTGYQTRL
ncbi:MAG: hypothetical protein LBJ20_01225 [Candidatus Methanoplasma sp.]|jgi:hypothetical protein|nr:hypothetical protein [Candidatus Methanoplasma sp.]